MGLILVEFRSLLLGSMFRSVNHAAKLVYTARRAVPIPSPTLIRSQFQAKPATLLILIHFFLEGFLCTRYPNASFSLNTVGSNFSLPVQTCVLFSSRAK